MTIQVRKLSSEDFDRFIILCEQLDEIHRLALPEHFRRPATPFRTKDYYEKIILDPQALLLGSFREGILVGFAHIVLVKISGDGIHVPRDYVLIDNFVIDEKVRGQGVGKSLFNKIESWAAEKNAKEIQLNVYAFNRAALNFYKKLGFKDLRVIMTRSVN